LAPQINDQYTCIAAEHVGQARFDVNIISESKGNIDVEVPVRNASYGFCVSSSGSLLVVGSNLLNDKTYRAWTL
jgi:hypothetical protein